MNGLKATLAVGAGIDSGRIDPRDALALVANPGLMQFAWCPEVTLMENACPNVRIAPDGTWCELADYGVKDCLTIGEFVVIGKIILVVDGPVPVYRVDNAEGVTAVIVVGREPKVLTDLVEVRSVGDEHYVITRQDDVDTLWALWNNRCSEELQASRVIKVHDGVLIEYWQGDEHFLRQYGSPSTIWLVLGRLVSAALALTGMLVAILENDCGGRSIVRADDERIVRKRHQSFVYCSEVHGEKPKMLDGVGDLLVSSYETVACSISSGVVSNDVLIIGESPARFLGQAVQSLIGYPYLVVRHGNGVALVNVNGAKLQVCMRQRQFLRNYSTRLFVGEFGNDGFVVWGDQLEHRVDLRMHGKIGEQHFVQVSHNGFHKVVFAQRMADHEPPYVLTDGWVQYGVPFDELLKIERVHGTGRVLVWVRRGTMVTCAEPIIIAESLSK